MKRALYPGQTLYRNLKCKNCTGYTPLHVTCAEGHLDVARVLISEFKANVNSTDNTGDTPLHLACSVVLVN